jgi:hypothetical protein
MVAGKSILRVSWFLGLSLPALVIFSCGGNACHEKKVRNLAWRVAAMPRLSLTGLAQPRNLRWYRSTLMHALPGPQRQRECKQAESGGKTQAEKAPNNFEKECNFKVVQENIIKSRTGSKQSGLPHQLLLTQSKLLLVVSCAIVILLLGPS